MNVREWWASGDPLTIVDLGWMLKYNPASFNDIMDGCGWNVAEAKLIMQTALKCGLFLIYPEGDDIMYCMSIKGIQFLDDMKLQTYMGFHNVE